jgi:undecaprenyl-diphosphatase
MGLTENLAFDTVVHLATALAAVIYFWRDLLELLTVRRRLLWLVILATVITGLIGVGFKDFFEALFADFRWVGPFFMVTGVVILIGEWLGSRVKGQGSRKEERMNWKDACLIGLAQGAAIVPSLSRSAMTISAGLALGLERKLAARFAFIIAIPAIAGAGLLQSKAIFKAGTMGIGFWPLLFGFFAALLSGWLAIKFLMTLIERVSLRGFAYYCLVLGLAVTMVGMLSTPAHAAVKKKVAKKKVRRYRRPYYQLGSRPKFPVDSGKDINNPEPSPTVELVVIKPAHESASGKAGWFVEGGVAGGGIVLEGGYGKPFGEKMFISGAAGAGSSFFVLDPLRVGYDLGNGYFAGGGLSCVVYSDAGKNQAGIELAGGRRLTDRLSARVAASSCLGLRAVVCFDY